MKPTRRSAIGLAVGAALLGLLVWRAGPAEILDALARAGARPGHLAGAVALFLATTVGFVVKWHVLARAAGAPLAPRGSLHLFSTLYLVGLFTPARAGEALVPLLMKSGGRIMGVTVVNRLLESLWTLCAGILAAAWLLRGEGDHVRLWPLAPALAVFFGLAVALSRRGVVEGAVGLVRGLLRRLRRFRAVAWLEARVADREDDVEHFLEANQRLLRPGPVLGFSVLMLAIWLMMVAANFLLVQATVPPGTREVTFAVVFGVMIVGALAMFVSPIPGGLGLSEVSAVGVFHVLGYPAEGASLADAAETYAAFLLVSRLLLYASTLLLYAAGRLWGRPVAPPEAPGPPTADASGA